MTSKTNLFIQPIALISFIATSNSLALPQNQPSSIAQSAVIKALHTSGISLTNEFNNQTQLVAKTLNHPVKVETISEKQNITQQPVAARYTRARSIIARATAYNSLASQTDSTPHITATGTRTRPGVIALSRDLLKVFPYGSRVRIQDLTGKYNFRNRIFIVEDTMNKRKRNSVDIWMYRYRDAIQFGARKVRVTAVR